ncbi:MAG: amidohydrolase family protein, partial [Verrucomicrobiales bacterium]|nr:amidohydrolase family protein [Verrucomicrobiales bacterium]
IGNLGGPDLQINLPLDVEILEAKGKHIYPGMIAANSVLGLTEINAVRATRDMIEPGEINPNARAIVSINPDSELIPVTRANGVLATLTIPRTGSGGLIAGQSALIRLDGWTWEDMEIKSPVGLHVFWPSLRTYSRWTSSEDEEELEKLRKAYAEKVRKIENAFADARAYQKAKKDQKSNTENDLRWEAMVEVLEGKATVFIHANTIAQIRAALHFAETNGIEKPVIVGGIDAPKAVSELKEQEAAVILGAVNSLPIRRYEAYDTPYVAAKKLHEAGIPFCISNTGSAFDAANERNLPYQAGRAVAHGLPHDIGLKSVTLFPAQILGVADRLGSIEEGKEATFFLSNGDPLEVRTNVEAAWVQGRKIDLSSRHTQLWKKYSERNRQKKEAAE